MGIEETALLSFSSQAMCLVSLRVKNELLRRPPPTQESKPKNLSPRISGAPIIVSRPSKWFVCDKFEHPSNFLVAFIAAKLPI